MKLCYPEFRMPVRNGKLASATSGGSGAFTIGTVPSTDTWILKDIRGTNRSGGAAVVQVFITDSVHGVNAYVVNQSVPALGTYSWSGWVAMGPNDTLNFNGGAASVDVYASGADLPGHL